MFGLFAFVVAPKAQETMLMWATGLQGNVAPLRDTWAIKLGIWHPKRVWGLGFRVSGARERIDPRSLQPFRHETAEPFLPPRLVQSSSGQLATPPEGRG